MSNTITRNEILQRIKNNLPMTIIEALPPQYFEDGHLPGAINLPHDQVQSRAEAMLPDKDAFIVVYCANTPCSNSGYAVNVLIQMGYHHVYEYVEGKQDWLEAGLILEKGGARKAG